MLFGNGAVVKRAVKNWLSNITKTACHGETVAAFVESSVSADTLVEWQQTNKSNSESTTLTNC
jgi:hypothetical protein